MWLGSPEAADRFEVDKLSPAERTRYDGLKGELRRREFAVSRALRAAATGSSSDDPSHPSSLSHSHGWAAVASACADCQVGVDLEFYRPRNLLGIARFAFDPAEIAMLEARPPEQQHQMFFTLWTLKESMAKALGVPLLVASRECVFTLESAVVPGSMGVQDSQWGRSVASDSVGVQNPIGPPSCDSMGVPDSHPVGVQNWKGHVPTERPWLVRAFRPRPDMALSVAVIGSDAVDSVITHEWPDARPGNWQPVVALRSNAGS